MPAFNLGVAKGRKMVYNVGVNGRDKDMTNEYSKAKAPYKEVVSYLGWLLAGKLAEWHGMKVGVQASEDGEVFALVIELPSGQVHRVIPAYAMEGKWKKFNPEDFQDRPWLEEIKSIEDCLNGVLVHRSTLIIPEQGEKDER